MGASLPTQIKACFNAMQTSLSSPSHSTKKFKVMPSAGKIMLTVFWDSQEVLLAHLQEHGENVNSASYNGSVEASGSNLQKTSRPPGKRGTASS
jgi:hypothetical protein